MNQTVTGHCLCGQTSYEFDLEAETQDFGYCHCRECRRQYGHYAAFAGIKSKNFRITKDKYLKWFQSSNHAKRGFCEKCGTPLFFKNGEQDEFFISVGTANDDSVMKERLHIFVDEKGSHYEINDACEQYISDPWIDPNQPPSEDDLKKARVKYRTQA